MLLDLTENEFFFLIFYEKRSVA